MTKKILCTLGPASMEPRVISRLSQLKVDLFRINLSHTNIAQLEEWVKRIRTHSNVPVCVDSQGAQVRTGAIDDGTAVLEPGATVQLSSHHVLGNANVVPLYPDSALKQLRVGDLLCLDFHSVVLQVTAVGHTCETKVLCGGKVGSNKAVSLDRVLALPPLTEIDRAAMSLVRKLDIHHVALSFANRRSDVEQLRELLGPAANITAKIESRSGIEHLDEILQAADAILIDRGDLSREVRLETIPLIQKEIIRQANRKSTPVFVATNLLESMTSTPKPTRAEVNDVMNTLLDGADGLVLAAETAIGDHPINCVEMIRSLIDEHGRSGSSANIDSLLSLPPSTSGIITPHGGTLVEPVITAGDDALLGLPTIDIDDRAAKDALQMAVGVFSPVDSFMTSDQLNCVLDTNYLPDDNLWPMPILFQLPTDVAEANLTSGPLRLTWKENSFGLLRSPRYFRMDLRDLARRWFGTDNAEHPGVAELLSRTDHFVSGRVELLKHGPGQREPFGLTPAQARLVFEHRGWHKVVGFHTPTVPDRVQEYVQLQALREANCDGLFIHPLSDQTRGGDWNSSVIVRAYEILIAECYPRNSAIVTEFSTYRRYAGPREELFVALCKQNYGCSHFIVWPNHADVTAGTFYAADAARRLIDEVAPDMAIEPVFCDEVYYCRRCGQARTTCQHGTQSGDSLSAGQVHQMLQDGTPLPEWFIRAPVSSYLQEELGAAGPMFVP